MIRKWIMALTMTGLITATAACGTLPMTSPNPPTAVSREKASPSRACSKQNDGPGEAGGPFLLARRLTSSLNDVLIPDESSSLIVSGTSAGTAIHYLAPSSDRPV